MKKTVLTSLSIEDLQEVIIDCINTCLRNSQQQDTNANQTPEQLIIIQKAAQLTINSLPDRLDEGDQSKERPKKRDKIRIKPSSFASTFLFAISVGFGLWGELMPEKIPEQLQTALGNYYTPSWIATGILFFLLTLFLQRQKKNRHRE